LLGEWYIACDLLPEKGGSVLTSGTKAGLLCLLMILFVWLSSLHAAWIQDGVAIGPDPTEHSTIGDIIPDGAGGAVVTWMHDGDAWCQRVDDSGATLWKENETRAGISLYGTAAMPKVTASHPAFIFIACGRDATN
jgi:hypothetical protein